MTPVSSLEALQARETLVCVEPDLASEPGVVGACVSGTGQALVEALRVAWAEWLPAASRASTAACPVPDTQAPTTPGSLAKSGSTQTSVSLAWSASSDDTGVTGYTVYRDGTSAGAPTGTSYTVSGLSCGTSYLFAVEARDAAGNHSVQTTLTASTDSCSASSANLYLSPSGSDSNPCSQTAPCLSLNRAYRVAKPGAVAEMKE